VRAVARPVANAPDHTRLARQRAGAFVTDAIDWIEQIAIAITIAKVPG
jgi:hypothetical protein